MSALRRITQEYTDRLYEELSNARIACMECEEVREKIEDEEISDAVYKVLDYAYSYMHLVQEKIEGANHLRF